jgi:hypothetical protein
MITWLLREGVLGLRKSRSVRTCLGQWMTLALIPLSRLPQQLVRQRHMTTKYWSRTCLKTVAAAPILLRQLVSTPAAFCTPVLDALRTTEPKRIISRINIGIKQTFHNPNATLNVTATRPPPSTVFLLPSNTLGLALHPLNRLSRPFLRPGMLKTSR